MVDFLSISPAKVTFPLSQDEKLSFRHIHRLICRNQSISIMITASMLITTISKSSILGHLQETFDHGIEPFSISPILQ